MDIDKEKHHGVGKVIDVVIDTANVIVETTKELPSERRLNVLFPFLAALAFGVALILVVNYMIKKGDSKEKQLNDRQDLYYEQRRVDFVKRLSASDSTIRVKDSTILILTKDKIESNDKTIQTQELIKKLLRKK